MCAVGLRWIAARDRPPTGPNRRCSLRHPNISTSFCTTVACVAEPASAFGPPPETLRTMRQQLRARNLRHRAESCPPSIGATAEEAGKRRCTHCRRMRVTKAYSGSRYRRDDRWPVGGAEPKVPSSPTKKPLLRNGTVAQFGLSDRQLKRWELLSEVTAHSGHCSRAPAGHCRVTHGRAPVSRECRTGGARGTSRGTLKSLVSDVAGVPYGLCYSARKADRCAIHAQTHICAGTYGRRVRCARPSGAEAQDACAQLAIFAGSDVKRLGDLLATTRVAHIPRDSVLLPDIYDDRWRVGRPRTRVPPCWQAQCRAMRGLLQSVTRRHGPARTGCVRTHAHVSSRSALAHGVGRCGGNAQHAHAQDSAAAARDARPVLVLRRRRRSRSRRARGG